MSLTGSFSTMPLSDLLQWLSDARKSGELAVSLEFEERLLRIADGNLVALEVEDPAGGGLGALCLEAGMLDEAGLARLLEASTRSGRPFQELLAEEPWLPTEWIDRALTAHATRVVLELFLWREGRFHFGEGESPLLSGASAPSVSEALPGASPGTPHGAPHELTLETPLPLRGLIMEGMRRLDEWQMIVEVFPSDYCQVHALGRDPALPILDELLARGEPVSLGELWSRGAERYRIYEQLYQAYNRGLLAVDSRMPLPSEVRENPLDVLVRNGAVLLDERQYDEASILLRSVLSFDPRRADVRDLLRRVREEQLAELYQTIPPYRVPVLAVPREALARLSLTPRERHLAGRVNGRWDVGALVVVTPIGELETMRALKKLLHVGAIRFAD